MTERSKGINQLRPQVMRPPNEERWRMTEQENMIERGGA